MLLLYFITAKHLGTRGLYSISQRDVIDGEILAMDLFIFIYLRHLHSHPFFGQSWMAPSSSNMGEKYLGRF